MARKATDLPDASTWPDEHPLFPVEEGDMPPAIAWIHVTRYEKGGQIWAERLFKAEELTDLSQVGQLYGGGQYELIGRQCSKKDPMKPGNILARRRYRIGGKSLPITDIADDEVDAAAPPFVPNSGGLGVGGDNQVLLAILQMSQQQQMQAASQQQASSQQFMQMMMQSMSSSKSESTALVTMMMQMSQQQQQSMVSMITAMMANRGGGPEEMAKYAELLKTLGFGGKNEEKEDEGLNLPKMLEDAADVVQGLAQMRGLDTGGITPPAHAPPGSAASVIAGGSKG